MPPLRSAQTCTEPGCDRKPHGRNLCSTHYDQRKRAGTLPPKLIDLAGSQAREPRRQRRIWASETCTEFGCGKPPVARNLCSLHYQRRTVAGTLPPKVRHKLEGEDCTVKGCVAPAKARKMCQRHYQLSRRYGYSPEELPELDARKACEACGGGPPFHNDHDHVNGNSRGTLCAGCNTALGLLGESVPRLVGLLAYLVKHQRKEI